MKSIDLTQRPPRSPRVRIRDYAILARVIDKARAHLTGKTGGYHYDCPLDRTLFVFKGVTGNELLEQVRRERSDEDLGLWLDEHGRAKTPEEICAWSDSMEAYRLYNNLQKRATFVQDCERLGLDPVRTSLFEWLETDDRASYREIANY